MEDKSFIRSEKAVSEVLGFITVLGIMLVAVSIIAVSGFPLIDDMKSTAHKENIRQSFMVLDSSFDKVVFGKAPSQSVEMKLYDGIISIRGNSYINISSQVWNESNSSHEFQHFERQMRKADLEFMDLSIGYENTGVWEKYEDGNSLMVSAPSFIITEGSMMIPVAFISGSESLSGQGHVRVISEKGNPSVHMHQNVSEVKITIMSDYYKAWGRYLEDYLGMEVEEIDDLNKTVCASLSGMKEMDVYIMYSPSKLSLEQ
ncbi:DUF7289 family protein [Methanosalsum zhilinae]